MRIIDVMLCFPFYVLALSVMAFLGNSLAHLIIIIAFFTFAPSARLIRMVYVAAGRRVYYSFNVFSSSHRGRRT